MSETRDRVAKIVVEHLGVDAETVTDDAVLIDDLGADSLDLVELEMALEDEFGFRFSNNDDGQFQATTTVAQVVEIVDRNKGA